METRARRVASWSISSGLHATVLAVLVLASLRGLSDAPPGERLFAVVTIPPRPEPTVADVIADNQRRDEADRAEDRLAVPGLDIDISRIRARQDALFPLLTDGLPKLVPSRGRAALGRESLIWFVPDVPGASGMPPLRLNDAEVTRIVDRAWSRRDRWPSFAEIATLVSEHDPDAGSAAELVRTHVHRNLLQPYSAGVPPDKGFWALLNLAVDQQPIIRFVERFAAQHPGSRVATELLFFLDQLAEANRTTLLMLLVTEPGRDLILTRDLAPDAYELALAVRDRYIGILRSRQLDSRAGIDEVYDEVRIHLLRTILETTPDGYGAADARYLLGRIYWDQKRFADAMDWWRAIQPDSRGLYAPFYERIVPQLLAPPPDINATINAALGAERLAWRLSSTARLKQFGYTPSDY